MYVAGMDDHFVFVTGKELLLPHLPASPDSTYLLHLSNAASPRRSINLDNHAFSQDYHLPPRSSLTIVDSHRGSYHQHFFLDSL